MPISRARSLVMIGVVTLTASVAGLATPLPDSPAQGAAAAPQTPVAPAAGGRQGGPPTRDPLAPGYVKATELPDGQVPPVTANGNFIIGPTHPASPDSAEKDGVAKGTIHTFTMESADSKIYPGIVRQPGARQEDPSNPAKLNVPSGPGPYTRRVAVYIPAGYTPGAILPLIVGADGPDQLLFTALDNLIAQKKIPPMVAVSIGNGGSDAQGSQRGLEYDTMSGLYAEFVETEVLPAVEQRFGVRLTRDPNSRATMGCSSGAAAALSMAWYRNDLYHRVLSYSGTYVNQQWPWNPETPGGAWEFHRTLIPNSPKKRIRLWMHVSDRDNLSGNRTDNMHDWVIANQNMAKVLADKAYDYQFTFSRNSGHCDRAVKLQTLPQALEWLWQGHPLNATLSR
jgi:enterochelin esterase family protein